MKVNKEKWIEQQIQELKDDWPQTSANDYCEPMLRQAILKGLEAPDFTKYIIRQDNGGTNLYDKYGDAIAKVWGKNSLPIINAIVELLEDDE